MTMADIKIHTVRFYKLEPKGINCMTYKKKDKKLALSRSDASIEIWNLSDTPHLEKIIGSPWNGSIEALSWCNDRLFSVGLTGQLIEYDLKKLTKKYAILITGGEAWCMDVHEKSKKLVIGTEQGYMNLYSITDHGVEYVKIFDKQDGRILCVSFEHTGKFVASGSIDTVRVWNVENGHAIHKMNISRLHTNKETVVWCLVITDDFTIISGDSRGFITFWDGEMGSQMESYQSHVASVLTLCLSENQKTVYSAGVDPVIMSYERVNVKEGSKKWVKSIQRKIHDHDVRNLLLIDEKLYSAGVDGYLACSSYPPRILVKYPPLLQNSFVSVARDVQFVLLRYQTCLEVWKLGKENSEENTVGFCQLEEEPKKLLLLQSKRDEYITNAAISNDGLWIIYSTCTRINIFHFTYNNDVPQLTKISNLPEECTSCVRAAFTPNSHQLVIVTQEGDLQFYNLSGDQIFLSQAVSTSKYIQDTVTFLTISSCGKYLVVADPYSNIAVYKLNDSCSFYCKLPRYKSSPTALDIQPHTDNLIIVYADHKIVEYDLKLKKFTAFSRGLDGVQPKQWSSLRSLPIMNVCFDPNEQDIIFLQDDSTLCTINKKKELPKADAKIPKIDLSSSNDEFNCARIGENAFHRIKRQKHVAYFGWISDGEMLSVEVNPLSLLESLPPCLDKKKFGTK